MNKTIGSTALSTGPRHARVIAILAVIPYALLSAALVALITLCVVKTYVQSTAGALVIAALVTVAWVGWGVWKGRKDEGYTLRLINRWVPLDADGKAVGEQTVKELHQAGLSLNEVDLYRAPVNGYLAVASGRHSVALEEDVVEMIAAEEENPRSVAAFITHELGHLHSGQCAHGPLVLWLSFPAFFLIHLVRSVTPSSQTSGLGRLGQEYLALVVLATSALAVPVLYSTHPVWLTIGVTSVLLWLLLLALAAHAQREDEFRADRFAYEHGFAVELAAGLRNILQEHGDGPPIRVFASHPPLSERIARLEELTGCTADSMA